MIERRDLYIDGQWVTPTTAEVITVDEAATGDIIGTVPAGDATDAERAILAARRSADTWAQVPIAERADIVTAIASGLREREAELARIMAQEVGTPLATAARLVHLGVRTGDRYSDPLPCWAGRVALVAPPTWAVGATGVPR